MMALAISLIFTSPIKYKKVWEIITGGFTLAFGFLISIIFYNNSPNAVTNLIYAVGYSLLIIGANKYLRVFELYIIITLLTIDTVLLVYFISAYGLSYYHTYTTNVILKILFMIIIAIGSKNNRYNIIILLLPLISWEIVMILNHNYSLSISESNLLTFETIARVFETIGSLLIMRSYVLYKQGRKS